MDVTITGRHVDVTPELHTFITERIEKLERFSEPLFSAHVTLTREADQYEVEMTVGVRRGMTLVARADADDITTGVIQVESKIESQLRKYKEKVLDHHRQRKQHTPPPQDVVTAE